MKEKTVNRLIEHMQDTVSEFHDCKMWSHAAASAKALSIALQCIRNDAPKSSLPHIDRVISAARDQEIWFCQKTRWGEKE